jgi:monofunctional glycosyltransferase
MEKALAHNDKKPKRVRGGSTISQQTAKNVFLWPDRTYVRKGLEAYFTVLIEGLWGKKRIMEVYLNVVEMGSGVYGAEAASQVDFGHSARKMSTSEASRLVTILPNPLKYNAVDPGAYVQRRAGRVAGQMGVVRSDSDLSGCIK